MTNTELLQNFENHLKIRDYSKIYLYHIKEFLSYCNDHQIDPLKITYQNLSSFLLSRKEQNNSNGYINNFIKALRCFYFFLEATEFTGTSISNLVRSFKILRTEQKIKFYLTIEEVEDIIIQAITYGYGMSPEKMKVIILFMFYTGLRLNEILVLKRQDINLSERYAIVRLPTKTKIEHYVYFPTKVVNAIQRYYDTEEEETNAFNVSRNQIKRLFRFLDGFLADNKHISPHTMRHSFANMLAKEGFDIRVAQKLLGHKNIKSTMIYYNPDEKIVKELYHKKIK
jgi:site-specific recombinase XerD